MLSDEQVQKILADADEGQEPAEFCVAVVRAIEAEVRKQDKALIEQLYEAIAYVRHTPEHSYDSNLALKQMNAALVAA